MEMAAVIVIGLGLAVLVLYVNWWMAEQRRKRFAAVAVAEGLKYSASDDWNMPGFPFRLFNVGRGRTAENLVYGMWQDRKVVVFDYSYYELRTNGKTTTRQTYRFTCGMTDLPVSAPHTTIEPESLFAGLARAVGLGDLQFESEEFNRAWKVKSADARFANYLVDPRMMEWLLASEGWDLELNGDKLLVSCGRLDPEQIPLVLRTLVGFTKRVPRVVSDVYGG